MVLEHITQLNYNFFSFSFILAGESWENMKRKENPSRTVALDLMLRTFMNSSEFNDIQNKNWDAIAKLIPGTTTQEVR